MKDPESSIFYVHYLSTLEVFGKILTSESYNVVCSLLFQKLYISFSTIFMSKK